MPFNGRRELQQSMAVKRTANERIRCCQSCDNRCRTAAKPTREWNTVAHTNLCAAKLLRTLRFLQEIADGLPDDIALISRNVSSALTTCRDRQPGLVRQCQGHFVIQRTGKTECIKSGTEIRTRRRDTHAYTALCHIVSSCPSATRIRLRTSRTTGSACSAAAAAEASACVTTCVTATISASPLTVDLA